ncbi:sporulation protein [Nocardiopsis sp. NPDC058631]|uniref:sporulation protein n=1 Tax=Nocardiopsis sp. NPDC058631 TaxID=3346566 RepID=UPI00365F61EA
MVFKRLLAAFGVGGLSIDTVVETPHTRPGSVLEGRVELSGGEGEAEIAEIVLALVVGVEDGDEHEGVEFARVPVASGIRLAAGETLSVPFTFGIPWQTPVTEAGGGSLPGVMVGLRTEVVVDGASDKGDLDRLHVHPLPVQERVLEALARLGFGFKNTGVETGYLSGTAQEYPFFQEFEFHPSERYAHDVSEVEIALVPDPEGVSAVVEFDRRGGMFSEDGEVYSGFRVGHAEADRLDWAGTLDSWIGETLRRHRELFGGPYPGEGEQYYEEEERGGMLGAVGGVAAGVVGGLAAGYVVSEIVDGVGEDPDPDEEDQPAEEEDAEEEDGESDEE